MTLTPVSLATPATVMTNAIPQGTWLEAIPYGNEDPKGDIAETFSEHRCLCGKLLFQMSAEGIFLKCPRCKRIALLTVSELVTQIRFQARDPESRADPKSPSLATENTANHQVASSNKQEKQI